MPSIVGATDALPPCAAGPQHTYSLPPDLQSAPALAAHRLGMNATRPQPGLASAQTLPAARCAATSSCKATHALDHLFLTTDWRFLPPAVCQAAFLQPFPRPPRMIDAPRVSTSAC